ncbi:MAG: FtsQ-type POTRA domain-containing protein, partial [Clostridia bacterium]|nr:FtsQ-type POTRA domain-containing protein [Clostridia bacterium]
MRRIAFFSVLALIAVLIVMLFTPIFNIKSVEIVGNSRISTEEITSTVGEIEGKNLFRYRKGKIKGKLYKLAYVDKVTVRKKAVPPTITIDIKECIPAFQAEYGGAIVVVDK